MTKMQAAQRIGAILILAMLSSGGPAWPQESRVRITSPASVTVVRPGQTIVISVAADSSVEKLALLGQHPLPIGQVVSGGAPGVVARGLDDMRPIEFQLKIPTDIRPGTYHVTAMGSLSGGETISDAVTLDVERAEEPGRIWTEPSTIHFLHAGDQIPLRVLGAFGDGSQEELTKSRKTSYTSANPRVATVSADGLVTAVASGKTAIQVRTPTRDYSIPITVE